MNSSKVYIILGPPGSGKGTQAKKLAQSLGSIYFGTGDLMREEIEKESLLGLEFKEIIEKGKLVGDNLVEEFVGQKLEQVDMSRGLVFDGFPRTIAQAKYLEQFLSKKGINHLVVLNLVVKPQSLVERMQKRRICQKCGKIFQDAVSFGLTKCNVCGGKLVLRDDNKPEILGKRIQVYQEQTAPLVGYYKSKGSLIEIDGEPPIEEVWKEIQRKIRNPNDKCLII